MTPNPKAVEAIGRLSDAMNAPSKDRKTIQQILAEIRTLYPDVYETESSKEVSIVKEAIDHLGDLKSEVEGIPISGYMINSPEILATLKKYGEVKDGVFIPDSPEIKRDFEEFKDLMGFIENTEREYGSQAIVDKAGLVERYERLLAPTNTRFIKGARYLQIMYAEALYEDIIARGFIYKRDGVTGEYEIICPKVETDTTTGKKIYIEEDLAKQFPDHPYLRLLRRAEVSDMMDMMTIGSIITKDAISYDSMDLVGQDDMIKAILYKHKILGPDGNNIQNARLILTDWEAPATAGPHIGKSIKDQILEARIKVLDGDEQSTQAYQELQYILDFMENKDYLNPDRSTKMFGYANVYRKTFLAQQAFIDAGGGDIGDITDKNIFDHIAEIAKGNKVAGIGVAIFALIAGFKKTALTAFFLALFGDKIADTGSSVLNEGKAYANSWTKEQLGILDPQDIRYNLDVPSGIDEADIQSNLDKLFEANEAARDSGGLSNSVTLTHTVPNVKVAKVYQFILGDDTLLQEPFSASDAAATSIEAAMSAAGALAITGSEFDTRVPESEKGNITQADIRAVLTLMETTIKEDSDTSFGDVVYSGIDPIRQPYIPAEFGFYGESGSEFETLLNTLFLAARSGAVTRKDVAKVTKTRDTIANIFIGAGAPSDLSAITEVAVSALLRSESEEAQEVIGQISSIPDAELTFGGTNYKAEILVFVEKYRDYSDVDEFLLPYDGRSARAGDTIDSFVSRVQEFSERRLNLNASDPDAVQREIDNINEELLKFADPTSVVVALGTRTVDISSDALYKPLLERYEAIKLDLEQEKGRLETLKAEIEAQILAGLSGVISGNMIIRLTPQEITRYKEEFRDGDLGKLRVISDEVQALGRVIQDGNRVAVTDLSAFIRTYASAYARLRGIDEAIKSVTFTPPATASTVQNGILSATQLLLSGAGTDLLTTIQTEITREFEKSRDIYDQVDTITVSATTPISELETYMNTVVTTERALITDILGMSVGSVLDGSNIPLSEGEKALTEVNAAFGTTLSVPNQDKTSRAIYDKMVEKRDEIIDQIKVKITARATTLDDLVEMYKKGLIEFAHEQNPSLGLKDQVKDQIEARLLTKIATLGTVKDVLTYMEDDFTKAREVFEWSLRDQPSEVFKDLDIDNAIADKLKERLTAEITALGTSANLNQAGLDKAEKLAELMGWKPPVSVAGRWRDIVGENFTDFTGYLGEDPLKADFETKLTAIRDAIMSAAPASGTELHTVLDAIGRNNRSGANVALGRSAIDYKNGNGGKTINMLLLDSDFKDRADILDALRKDYLID